MISSGTIIQITEELAPKSLMMDWDNCGLMIGDYSKKISKVLFCKGVPLIHNLFLAVIKQAALVTFDAGFLIA